MLGESPNPTTFLETIDDTIRSVGISSDFEDIQKMIPNLSDFNMQYVLIELFANIYYPVSIGKDIIIIFFPARNIIDLETYHLILLEDLDVEKNLDDIIIDRYTTKKQYIYLLNLWMKQIYPSINIFMGNNLDYIQELDSKMATWGIKRTSMMPLFPVLFTVNQ